MMIGITLFTSTCMIKNNLTTIVQPLLTEFANVFLEELPYELPPLCDTQHHVDMVLGGALPNHPPRMSPNKYD